MNLRPITLILAALVLAATAIAFGCEESEGHTTPMQAAAIDPPPATPGASTTMGKAVKYSEPRVLLEDAGLRLDEVRWSFQDQRGSMWRVRLDRPARAQVLAADELTRIEAWAPETLPSATINGGFYHEWVWGYEPTGLVVSDGDERAELNQDGGSGVLYDDGNRVRIVHRDDFEPHDDIDSALQSVDRLVHNASSLVSRRRDPQRATRSAVALTDDALWLVLLAADQSIERRGDGLQLVETSSFGVPLWAFAELLVENIGPTTALNLDGSVSTQLQVHVGEGQRFGVRGDRGVMNAVRVTPRVEEP